MDLKDLKFIYNGKKILVIADDENNPWFKGKDVANTLGYGRPRQAISDNISDKNKIKFEDLKGSDSLPFKIHPQTIFINESALYKLIFRSNMPDAELFTDWVTKEVLPSIRKTGEYILKKALELQKQEINMIKDNYNKELEEKEIEKNQLLDENKQLKITNMNIQNFIDNTKEKSKTGYIYIATSKRYATMNYFKVGKTDNLKTRLSQFNCSHIKNDLFYICYYEKVFNPHKTEQIIHDVLDDFRDKKGKEIFILHYTTLLEVVKLIIKNINEPYDYINNIIKHKLSQMYELRPIIPEKIEIDEEKLALEELKEKINKILDEALTKGIFKMSRQELINKLDLNGNKIDLWNGFKKIIKWSNSNIPIRYKGKNIIITYR